MLHFIFLIYIFIYMNTNLCISFTFHFKQFCIYNNKAEHCWAVSNILSHPRAIKCCHHDDYIYDKSKTCLKKKKSVNRKSVFGKHRHCLYFTHLDLFILHRLSFLPPSCPLFGQNIQVWHLSFPLWRKYCGSS